MPVIRADFLVPECVHLRLRSRAATSFTGDHLARCTVNPGRLRLRRASIFPIGRFVDATSVPLPAIRIGE